MRTPGRVWNTIDMLCPCVRDRFIKLSGALSKLGIPYKLLETLRDEARQRHYISIGVSKTLNSKHLPQPPNGLALAFDLAPTEYMKLKNWNPNGPLWKTIHNMSVQVGLKNDIPWDKPHHQLNNCECIVQHDEMKV